MPENTGKSLYLPTESADLNLRKEALRPGAGRRCGGAFRGGNRKESAGPQR